MRAARSSRRRSLVSRLGRIYVGLVIASGALVVLHSLVTLWRAPVNQQWFVLAGLVRIDGSYIGESGQDGVVAVAALLPAVAEIDVRNSTIENAAQTNVEGTMLALPPSDPAESRVSVTISGSTIRNAGAVAGFEQSASNVLIVGSRVMPKPQPFPRAATR